MDSAFTLNLTRSALLPCHEPELDEPGHERRLQGIAAHQAPIAIAKQRQVPAECHRRGYDQIAWPAEVEELCQIDVLDLSIAETTRARICVGNPDQGRREPAASHLIEHPRLPPRH